MKKADVIFVAGLFGIVFYIFVVLCVLNTMGQINLEVKKAIYKYYNVPLKDENENRRTN